MLKIERGSYRYVSHTVKATSPGVNANDFGVARKHEEKINESKSKMQAEDAENAKTLPEFTWVKR